MCELRDIQNLKFMNKRTNVELANNSTQSTNNEEFYLTSLDEIRKNNPVITSDEILSYVNTIKSDESISFDGRVSIEFLSKPQIGVSFNHGAREYQREKVANDKWKQAIMETIFLNGFKKIPPLHLRIIREVTDGVTHIKIENIDGRQRASSPIDFVNGEFVMGNIPPVMGVDISGKSFEELRVKYPSIHSLLMDYQINCFWYDNISDDETADLFVNVLNNVNDMKPQEIRNAVRGYLSTYIRELARPYESSYKSTHFLHRSKSDSNKEYLTYMPKINMSGRMEVDEWVSQLIYMYYNGWKKGISQPKHTQWIKDEQKNGIFSNETKWKSEYQKEIKPLIDFASKIIRIFPNDRRTKLSSMFSLVLIHYGYEMFQQYENMIESVYVEKFLQMYDDWNCDTKKLYMNETQADGKQMGPISDSFNGKNKNALETIAKVLDKVEEISQWGVVELDPKTSFKRDDVMRKAKEQNWICPFTGVSLKDKIKVLVGDHKVARSKGIKAGGVTEYHNLIVTTHEVNRKKSTMSSEDFSEWCESFKQQKSVA
jgi:hypothetical protein